MTDLPKHKMSADGFLVWAEDPIILVEVLSPGTRTRDHGVKKEGYFALAGLEPPLIVDPARAPLVHHRRGPGAVPDAGFVNDPRLRLDPPGLDVDLTRVLAG